MLVWLREEKGLSESYPACLPSYMCQDLSLFGKFLYFQEPTYMKNGTEHVPACCTAQGPVHQLKSRGILSFASAGGEKKEKIKEKKKKKKSWK